MRRSRIALLAVSALAVSAPGQAFAHVSVPISTYFRSPQSNVVCGYFTAPGTTAFLECGVSTELNPPPPGASAASCHGLDPASNRVRLAPTGGAEGFCSGDVGVVARIHTAPVLAYGKSWHGGPFTCSSSVAWLTCKNSAGHGFALSRLHWRTV